MRWLVIWVPAGSLLLCKFACGELTSWLYSVNWVGATSFLLHPRAYKSQEFCIGVWASHLLDGPWWFSPPIFLSLCHPLLCWVGLTCATNKIWKKGWHTILRLGHKGYYGFHLVHSSRAVEVVTMYEDTQTTPWKDPCDETLKGPWDSHVSEPP